MPKKETLYLWIQNMNLDIQMMGNLFLIDEIHTPDSSRYFYQDSYEENLNNNKPQKQLSKEFFRQWLIENGFSGKEVKYFLRY